MELKSSPADLASEWALTASKLDSRDRQKFREEWGIAREKFCSTRGMPPLSQSDLETLGRLKGKYHGERIFIIGNGPSLNKMPLHLLRDEYTFGVNRIYLLYDRITWKPSFYTANDWRVVPDIADEISALSGSLFFFDQRFRGLLREGLDVAWYEHRGAPPGSPPYEQGFSTDMTTGIRGAGSVVGTAIQIASHLGFDPIYLIGCDLGYKVADTVLQEGEDKFGNGVKLHLTSTRDDDSNHFDVRYFGTGRRWHDPNVKRMIEGHFQCLEGAKHLGKQILNATIGGQLDVYPRVNFADLFGQSPRRVASHKATPLIDLNSISFGSFPEEAVINFDEPQLVSTIFADIDTNTNPIMLDVGAHRGSSLAPFARANWRIVAFEPDPSNRDYLEKFRAKHDANIQIIAAAVGEVSQASAPYFASEESSGVSGLSAFLPTHKKIADVEVVRLDATLKSLGITSVDYLKVDVEGFELGVLRSFPWGEERPRIVLVEYEDGKTIKQGYTALTMCRFLREKGYDLFICEWFPIKGYGKDHSFRRFYKWDNENPPSDGWGNILAIRDDISAQLSVSKIMSAALHALISGMEALYLRRLKKLSATSTSQRKPEELAETTLPKAAVRATGGVKVQSNESSQTPISNSAPSASSILTNSGGAHSLFPPPSLPSDVGTSSQNLVPKAVKISKKVGKFSEFEFDIDFEVEGLPSNEGFGETFPLMPFVIAAVSAYVTAQGELELRVNKKIIYSESLTDRRRFAIFAKGDRSHCVIDVNGARVYESHDKITEATEMVHIGQGYRNRGFAGKFFMGTVMIITQNGDVINFSL